jgi:hypothetical protein
VVDGAVKHELAAVVGEAQRTEKACAKKGAHSGGWEEVVIFGSDPAGTVEREAASSDDAVEVWMKVKLSGPRMKDDSEAELCAEQICREGVEGPSRCVEHEVVDPRWVVQSQGSELVWEGEDDVKVADGKDALATLSEPSSTSEGLAGGTMAVEAGVIHRFLMPTAWANLEVATKLCGAADLDIVEQASLLRPQRV